MTLKTLSGPSVQAALADARRVFGAGVVLLQSTPAMGGDPAQVTVAFDDAPRPSPRPAPAAAPAPEPAPPRAYGYAAVRNTRPAASEPLSVPSAPPRRAPVAPPTESQPHPELTAMRARVAALEAELARRTVVSGPASSPRRAPLVFVGPAGVGKSSLALRLAARPGLVGAASAAALVVAPDHPFTPDATPAFWEVGAPAARVDSAADVVAAQDLAADAELVVIDTPALPLDPAQAAAAVRRLAGILAPLAPLDVVFVVDAPRAGGALSADTIAALGLQPDGLAVTRLDETAAPASVWARHLGVPLRFASSSPMPDGLRVTSALTAAPRDARFLGSDGTMAATPSQIPVLVERAAEASSPLSSPVPA